MVNAEDFAISQYATSDGRVRVQKVGVFWYGERRSSSGAWLTVAEHCTYPWDAIRETLGVLAEEPEEEPDEDEWNEF